MKTVLRFLIVMMSIALAGCGGGGGNDALPTTSKVLASIDWAARTRGLKAPSSAQSVVITLKDALPGGGDFHFLINRDAAPAAYTQTYTSPGLAKLGTWTMSAMFYGQNDGSGDAVGTAGASVEIKADGTGLPTVATSGTFKSVSIPAGQTATIGTNQDLTVMAGTTIPGTDFTNSAFKEVAISPGSIVWKVIEGGDKLTFVDGMAKGIAPGVAKITATIDGIVSAAQTVTVVSTAMIVITPASATVQIGASQTFSAVVTNAPDSSVTWTFESLVPAQTGGGFPPTLPVGAITQNGVFTPPNVVGTYKVTATSKYDSTKSATAIVTVPSPVVFITLPTNDMVYEATTARLYATVPGKAGAQGNSIAIINPQTATVETTIPIGSEPGRLALADDGKTLYVVLKGTKTIVRFDIPSKTAGTPFSIASNSIPDQFAFIDMSVAPGNSGLLAVSTRTTYGNSQIAIYKDGVALPNSKIISRYLERLAFGATSARLYGHDDQRLDKIVLDASGFVSLDSSTVIEFNYEKMQYANGKLYFPGGKTYDSESSSPVGNFSPSDPNLANHLSIFPSIQKAISYDVFGSLSVYNMADYSLLSTIPLRNLVNYFGALEFTDSGGQPVATVAYSGGKSLSARDINNIYIVNPAPGL